MLQCLKHDLDKVSLVHFPRSPSKEEIDDFSYLCKSLGIHQRKPKRFFYYYGYEE